MGTSKNQLIYRINKIVVRHGNKLVDKVKLEELIFLINSNISELDKIKMKNVSADYCNVQTTMNRILELLENQKGNLSNILLKNRKKIFVN